MCHLEVEGAHCHGPVPLLGSTRGAHVVMKMPQVKAAWLGATTRRTAAPKRQPHRPQMLEAQKIHLGCGKSHKQPGICLVLL